MGLAFQCTRTLKQYLPDEDFDINKSSVVGRFSDPAERLIIADRLEKALKAEQEKESVLEKSK